MERLVDFEELIDLDALSCIPEENGAVLVSSQESLTDVLDKMCETLEATRNELIMENAEEKVSKGLGSFDTIIDLDEFDKIFHETYDNLDKLNKQEGRLRDHDSMEAEHYCTVNDLDDIADVVNNSHTSKSIFSGDNNKQENVDIKLETPTVSFMLDEATITYNDVKKDLEEKERLTSFKTIEFEVPNVNDLNNGRKVELDTISIAGHSKAIDVISVNYTESFKSQEYDEDDGYNSSDFEFISESEAKKQGSIDKTKLKDNFTNDNIISTPNVTNSPTNLVHKALVQRKNGLNLINYDPNNPDFTKYHRYRYLKCRLSTAKAQRATHVIPEGESYLDLFRGMRAPVVINNLYYASNKHALPAKSMTFNSDGFGFDLPECKHEENAEHLNEAAETLKKIHFLYSNENRKRRRM